MSKTHGLVLAAMLAVLALNIFVNAGAYAQIKSSHGKAVFTMVRPIFWVYWVGGLVVLELLADYAPVVAGWIVGLVTVGAVLRQGPLLFAQATAT